ncbi:MAG: hypothetical protein NW217_11590 [Hyphomicrobiaceae bacterium]|nr:hypothetical protein [Hyphomicrobiaceae bacterium]
MRKSIMVLGLIGLLISPGASVGQTRVPGSFEVANSCAAGCRAAHNQCRIATKGNRSCDARLQACLSGCLRR